MQNKADKDPIAQDPQQEQPGTQGIGPVDGELPIQLALEESAEKGLRCFIDESKDNSSITNSDEGQEDSLPIDPASQENLPFPIPREMCLHIFSFLNTQNLQSTALLSRQSYSLSTEIRKRHFLEKFGNSHWWKFLVALADNVPGEAEKSFVSVFILGMGPNIRIPDGWRAASATMSAHLARWMGWFPDKIQRLGFGISGYGDIQKKARFLLAMMCRDNDRTQFNACTRLRDCFTLVEDKNKVAAFQQYHDLDRLFSCLILFEFMSTTQADNRLNFLITTPFARGLTGEGLIALECQFPGIFPGLVREAIRLFQIEKKQATDLQRLEAVERLLGRLTEADILAYINTEGDQQLLLNTRTLQRQIFVEVLRSNYEFMMGKLTIAALIRLEYTIDYAEKFESLLVIPHIIQSRFVLTRLLPLEILSLLKLIRKTEIGQVINSHTSLQSFCTVEIMEELLKVDTGRSALARVFLTNKILLDKLSDNHIAAFAEHFEYTNFDAVLESDVFQARLRADSTNSLLMRLAKSKQAFTSGKDVLSNPSVSSLLTAEQAIELFDYRRLYLQDALFNNKHLMDKLSSTQLLHVIINCTNTDESRLLAVKGRLANFTSGALIQLTKIVFCEESDDDNLSLYQYLIESLPAEINRRVSQGSSNAQRFSSEQLCELSCIHPQLGCHILDHHGDNFTSHEIGALYLHYKSYDKNTAILIAIKIQQDKRIDKITQASRRNVAPKQTVSSPPTITTSIYVPVPEDPIEPKSTQEIDWFDGESGPWIYFIIQLVCIIGAVFGLFLAITGLGSALGIGIMVQATEFLFASLTINTALAAGIVGLSFYFSSAVGWLIVDSVKQQMVKADFQAFDENLKNKSHYPRFDTTILDAIKISHQAKNALRQEPTSRDEVSRDEVSAFAETDETSGQNIQLL